MFYVRDLAELCASLWCPLWDGMNHNNYYLFGRRCPMHKYGMDDADGRYQTLSGNIADYVSQEYRATGVIGFVPFFPLPVLNISDTSFSDSNDPPNITQGDSLIPGIPETLDKLKALGKKMYFVTNNSTKSRAGYKKKFDSLGLDIPAEAIFSSSFAAAAYLELTKFKDSGKKVYVIGEIGIGEELDLIGVDWFGGPGDKGKEPDMGPGGMLEVDKDVGAVIVGFDRNINYYKIQYAQLCINENEGCEFIATNCDAVTHLTDAQEWAGNGSMVGAIKGCTGQEPTVVGKPRWVRCSICDNYE